MAGTVVCMFVASPLRHDVRVEKEAATLAEAGYDVRIIATRHPDLPARERRAGATVVRVDDDPLPARLARAALRRRGRSTDPGALITREAVERPGVRGRALAAALRVHLRLAWWRYRRLSLRAAEPAALWVAHDLDTLPVALRARDRMGGKVLYDSHELFVDSSLARGERRRWMRLERRLIGRADAVVTVSGAIARVLAERYGIAEPALLLNAPPASHGERVDLRAVHDIPAAARVVLYLGGIQQHRGLEQLIRAAALRPDVVVVLLGPGTPSYRGELERVAAAAGVSERVRFAPPVDPGAIAAHAASADVGVSLIQNRFLSYYYALPNKLFDYLHAGLPVVVSDFPEMRALVERHDVGATCDPTSPPAIAAAIDRVAGQPSLRANARAAAPFYTWEREREKLLAIAASMVGSNRSASASHE
jgi:glycosyltransferase involved in cell wall biosynthesis